MSARTAATGLAGLLVAMHATACTTDVEARAEARARDNVLGKWRSVAYYCAEPSEWKGTYEFKKTGEVEIHATWKQLPAGEPRRVDEVRGWEARDGEVVIDGQPALIRVRPDGRLELVRLAHVTPLGAFMDAKIVFERETAAK